MFNRVVNVAHVHVSGDPPFSPYVRGRGRGAIITVFIIFLGKLQKGHASFQKRHGMIKLGSFVAFRPQHASLDGF